LDVELYLRAAAVLIDDAHYQLGCGKDGTDQQNRAKHGGLCLNRPFLAFEPFELAQRRQVSFVVADDDDPYRLSFMSFLLSTELWRSIWGFRTLGTKLCNVRLDEAAPGRPSGSAPLFRVFEVLDESEARKFLSRRSGSSQRRRTCGWGSPTWSPTGPTLSRTNCSNCGLVCQTSMTWNPPPSRLPNGTDRLDLDGVPRGWRP
jgi:hypothetical protein